VVADEGIAEICADQVKHIWVSDIRVPINAASVSTLPTPAETDYCAQGAHLGPHDLYESRPGSFVSEQLVLATYQTPASWCSTSLPLSARRSPPSSRRLGRGCSTSRRDASG
jgi:hypothetical protein